MSSVPAGDDGYGVSGPEALAGTCGLSNTSPRSDTLISLSVRSISPSLSCVCSILSYLLGAAWLTQPNVTIPVGAGNTCSS